MWSKILYELKYSDLTSILINQIHSNESRGCYYHNIDHIYRMYDYLEKSNEPYDEALDWAILAHDVVYDSLPDKEERSAKFFLEYALRAGFSLQLCNQIEEYIMATKFHLVEKKSWSPIIRADLHALTDEDATLRNHASILVESMKLYSISRETFAKNSIEFMEGLRQRIEMNMIKYDIDHTEFYSKVLEGIDKTIDLSNRHQREYYKVHKEKN
jgi:predicted metal-dependent HD superfamily phosphohydrolase